MWKLLATNDDVTTCECCGKSNLKMTVVMTNGETEVYYGRDCAARALSPRFPMTALAVQRKAEKAMADRERAERIATAVPAHLRG